MLYLMMLKMTLREVQLAKKSLIVTIRKSSWKTKIFSVEIAGNTTKFSG